MAPADASSLPVDLEAPRSLHIVGVGGSGMSGIATILGRTGHRVSGSDLKESTTLERLRAQGVVCHVGHDPSNLPAALDAVVVSTAIPESNPEVQAARERGVPVLRRAECLRLITRTRRTIAVSGTHGKTTTSSMLALVLREAGWRPSFLIGGDVNEVGGNAVHDEGEWLVVEADESDATFVELEAEAVVVTSVEPDHLEFYGGFEPLRDAFRRFVAEAPGPAVVFGDDDRSAELVGHAAGRVVTYGFSDGLDYRIAAFESLASTTGSAGCRFMIESQGDTITVDLPVPGRHNALNAAAAAAMAVELGAPPDAVTAALGRFAGVSRRFEFRGTVDGVTVVDDYAHLPTEVEAAIRAAREGPWERVVVIFQPHRFSRTETLWDEFAHSFDDADVLVLTDVYPAGEAPRPGVSGRLVLGAVLDTHPATRVLYLPRLSDVEGVVQRLARAGDVVLTLGAGDVTSATDAWLARVS